MSQPAPIERNVRRTAVLLAGALLVVVTLTLLPANHPEGFAVIGALLLVVTFAARAPWMPILQRLAWLAPFVAATAIAAAASARGPDWRWLAVRGGLCLYTIVLLGLLAEPAALLAVLRAARFPGLLLTTLTLMQRYVGLLGDESQRMGRARAARTFTRSRGFAWRAAASVVGVLFVRAYERAERVYDALLARGWRT